MKIIKEYGYVLPIKNAAKKLFEVYYPPTFSSKMWVEWEAFLTITTCWHCFKMHGRIYYKHEAEEPPVHPNCNCKVKNLLATIAGEATVEGENGADYWLKYLGALPDNYITKQEARDLGWKPWKGNLHLVAPWQLIGGDVYKNWNQKLPIAEGRIWCEADINYQYGYRSSHRILYSNDGLIFVTYDHYSTFVEIT